jgi:P-type Ca2+ transporter type 2A
MDQSFILSTTEVLKHFEVTEEGGLSSQQVVLSREKYGSNGMNRTGYYGR